MNAIKVLTNNIQKRIKRMLIVDLVISLYVAVMTKYSKPVQVYKGPPADGKKPEEPECCKKVKKKHFNKRLSMTEKNKRNLEATKICHIYAILVDLKDVRVRNHCHITRKYRGSTHEKGNFSFSYCLQSTCDFSQS